MPFGAGFPRFLYGSGSHPLEVFTGAVGFAAGGGFNWGRVEEPPGRPQQTGRARCLVLWRSCGDVALRSAPAVGQGADVRVGDVSSRGVTAAGEVLPGLLLAAKERKAVCAQGRSVPACASLQCSCEQDDALPQLPAVLAAFSLCSQVSQVEHPLQSLEFISTARRVCREINKMQAGVPEQFNRSQLCFPKQLVCASSSASARVVRSWKGRSPLSWAGDGSLCGRVAGPGIPAARCCCRREEGALLGGQVVLGGGVARSRGAGGGICIYKWANSMIIHLVDRVELPPYFS